VRHPTSYFNQSSASLDFIKLISLNCRVGFSYSLTSNTLIIKGAFVFVRIAVHCTKEVPTFAAETGQSNTLPACSTSAGTCLSFHLQILTRGRISSNLSRDCLHLHISNLNIHRIRSHSLFPAAARTAIHNVFNRGCRKFVLFLLQQHVLVTFGAHVHGGSPSKEATIVNAKDWPFWSLASCFIVRLHCFMTTCKHTDSVKYLHRKKTISSQKIQKFAPEQQNLT